jgi:hypothetical protein
MTWVCELFFGFVLCCAFLVFSALLSLILILGSLLFSISFPVCSVASILYCLILLFIPLLLYLTFNYSAYFRTRFSSPIWTRPEHFNLFS